nr:gamma-glutamylcyclotransferase family protein [uncultured Mucilaginibacter sp.]
MKDIYLRVYLTMPDVFLFVYGTLLQSNSQFAKYLRQHSRFYSAGKIRGFLYDVGEYPAFVADNKAGYVFGSLYSIENLEMLFQIDAYEGVGPDEEQPNLYTRVILPVETEIKQVDAWVYVYNLPVLGLPRIEAGDYLKYLGQKKSPGS